MFKNFFQNRFVFYVEYTQLDGYKPQHSAANFQAALRFLNVCVGPYYVNPVIVRQDTYRLSEFRYIRWNSHADRRIGKPLPCQRALRVLAHAFVWLELTLEPIHDRIFHKTAVEQYYYEEHPLFG